MTTNMFVKLTTGLLATLIATATWSFTPSTQPPESAAVPGNVLLALSVEFPTGLQISYNTETYSSSTKYDGYFDNRKCYTYSISDEVFRPTGAASADKCGDAEWGGNLLNWLTMTNLDQFRSVMTGGTRDNFSSMNSGHPGDTEERTVLIRSFSDRNSYTRIKKLNKNNPIPSSLRSNSDKFVRSGGYGSKFIISDTDNFNPKDKNNNELNHPGYDKSLEKLLVNTTMQKNSCANTTPLPSTGVCFNIRVEVCQQIPATGIPTVPREANCQAKYKGIAKPEGLIQEYANTLRFGAFGYLKEDGNGRNGGVLRSAMKSVGPIAVTSTSTISNNNKEWNELTGIMILNPDPVDATASSVNNSGLINYINKFGYASGYKGNDPVSELYYAALLYLRGHSLPADYTNSLNDTKKDGFPVITGSAHQRGGLRDPMINTCQKNFILLLGDIYTHCDGNLPGSTNTASCNSTKPTDPDNLDVQGLWNTVRNLENMPDARDSNGINGWAGGAGDPTPYVAGLAHWANTSDIRSDLRGKQSVSTYVVDVLENGNNKGGWPNAGKLRSQYWLAAKYGGFETSIADSSNPNNKRISWDRDSSGTNGYDVPDTWFAGSTPGLLRSGLTAAFSDIATRSSVNSASSAAVTSTRQTSNSQIIYAGYNPKDWSGTVSACKPTQTAVECSQSPDWEASKWFESTGNNKPSYVTDYLTADTRKIFTSYRGVNTFSKMPFLWDSLNDAQKSVLNSSDSQGPSRLSYVRGVRTNEGILFRPRPVTLLGDIVHSGVTYVGGPSIPLSGPRYPGHTAYRNSTKARPAVVYIGANDGMLHAFSATNGKELFAYIPSTVFDNLTKLSALKFEHLYFVDSTPMTGDFQKTTGWGTMLVGGLGAGGKGYYALDITNQSTFSTATESALSALPMWEFTAAQDSDLGYTFNEPAIDSLTGAYRQIAKVADATTADGVWRIVVGNGFGSGGGDAVLFMLNANTGAADIKVSTGNSTDNGLSTPTPVDTDRDGLIDTVYAGDLLGNMHKFQFSKLAGSDFVVAKSGDPNASWNYIGVLFSSGEPITTAPSVAPSCDGVGLNIAFGSGKLNEDDDLADKSRRGFYSVTDKGPSSSMTVSTSNLTEITYTNTTLDSDKVVRNWSKPNLASKRGWKMFFNNGERVLTNSVLPPNTGAVLFGTTKPSGDICTPGNTGFIMAVNLCSGGIGNMLVDGYTVGGLAINSTGVVKVSNTYINTFNKPTVVCNQDDCKGNPPTLNASIAPRGRYTWREILNK